MLNKLKLHEGNIQIKLLVIMKKNHILIHNILHPKVCLFHPLVLHLVAIIQCCNCGAERVIQH